MASAAPPTEFFPGINFNLAFYTEGDSSVSLNYVNNNFLRCTGYAYSRSIATTFNGILYCLGGIDTTNITASGTITGTTITGTTMSATNIGIGITNPTTSSIEIVRPVTTSTDLINMRYDATNGLRLNQAYVAANDVKQIFIQKNNNVDTTALAIYRGNIGIGTTAPLVEANTTRLHLYNASNSRILLDTTPTGTTALEFRRGTGFDIKQDFRFINDTDSTFKFQYENNQQAYADTEAQLMWVLPNTVSGLLSVKNWKNTEYVGNIGIGTTFHATRKLDVLGDVGISGTATIGTLSTASLNISSFNATRMNGTTQILIGDADYIGAAGFFISTTGTDASATKTVFTVNGVYELSVSSLLASGSKIELIFDNNNFTFWDALNNTYTKENALTTGRYLANTTGTINVNFFQTTVTTVGVIHGEWVQIKYPKRVAINNILYRPVALERAIIRGYLLGSNDGTTWEAVYSEFTVTTWTSNAERSLLPVGYTPNTKQFLFYRLVARQIQGLASGGLGATQKLQIATLRFTYNQNVAFIDSVLCIGDPVGGTTPAVNCILDINGATNMQGSVNILGNLGVGTTDTATYKLNVNGTSLLNGLVYIGTPAGSSTIFMGGGSAGDGGYDHSVIETRNYGATERTEMLLFKENDVDAAGDPGADRIRLRAGAIAFDTYSAGTVNRTAESIRMTIASNGNVNMNSELFVGGNTNLRNTVIYSGNESTAIGLYFSTPFTGTPFGATKSAIIAEPITNHSRHHLAFCMNRDNNNGVNVGTGDVYIRLHQDNYIQIWKPCYTVNNTWHHSLNDNYRRLYYGQGGETYYEGGAAGQNNGVNMSHVFRNQYDWDIFRITTNGSVSYAGTNQFWSDSRIKKEIEDINDDNALQMVLAIEPKTYKYIDGNKSKERVYGFIAQQIKEVVPEAIVIQKNIIPNIYKYCRCEENKKIYVVLPLEVEGKLIRLSEFGQYKIVLVEDEYIEVEKHMESVDISDGDNMVYGYEVDDFHTINKDYICTLNVCATQELHRRMEAQEKHIKELETKIEQLILLSTINNN